jgi:hypothetical protein
MHADRASERPSSSLGMNCVEETSWYGVKNNRVAIFLDPPRHEHDKK